MKPANKRFSAAQKEKQTTLRWRKEQEGNLTVSYWLTNALAPPPPPLPSLLTPPPLPAVYSKPLCSSAQLKHVHIFFGGWLNLSISSANEPPRPATEAPPLDRGSHCCCWSNSEVTGSGGAGRL